MTGPSPCDWRRAPGPGLRFRCSATPISLQRCFPGIGKTKEEARKDLADTARKKVLSYLVVYKIAEEEGLKPAKEEVESEVQKHQHEQANLDKQKFYDYIYGVLQNRKVFEFLEKQ